MNNLKICFLILLFTSSLQAQTIKNKDHAKKGKGGLKKEALYSAKSYLINTVLGSNNDPIKFEMEPLSAAGSGELTTLYYNSETKGKSGLIIGLYGYLTTKAGVRYKEYIFKNLYKKTAIGLIKKIDNIIEINSKYLNSDSKTNNVYFNLENITFLIYRDNGTKIRVFWDGFDAEWESSAFDRTRRRFARKIK